MFKSNVLIGPGFVNRYYSTKRLTNIEKDSAGIPGDSFSVCSDLYNILIGLILGDLYVNRRNNNTRLQFQQGLVHKEYIYHLFELFSSYSNMEAPTHGEYHYKRNNFVYSFIRFTTYSLPCLNYYHELFYVNRVKIIPLNIGGLLTSAGLAYWAMDDGCKSSPSGSSP